MYSKSVQSKAVWIAPLLTIVMVIALMLGLHGCGSSETASELASGADSLVIELTGVDSLSVLELLQTEHEVTYRSTLTGAFVTAIDSVEAGDGHFWVYTVNDTAPSVACDKYVTSEGDRVKWHLRDVNP